MTSYEVQKHLKTGWTSCDQFSKVIETLRNGLQVRYKDYVLGFKETFSLLDKDSMRIFAVIACVGSEPVSRLVQRCFDLGVPLVLGRGHLGAAFGKGRVACVALLKPAAGLPEMLDFVINLSQWASVTDPALDEVEDLREKFISVCNKGSVAVVVDKKNIQRSQQNKHHTQNIKKLKANFSVSLD